MKDETRLAHAGHPAPALGRPVNPPLERGSTVLMPNAAALYADWREETVYGLQGLGVQKALCGAVAGLEGAAYAQIFPSGLAALVAAVMAVVKAGDEILITDAVYSPTRRFCDYQMGRFGITTRYYPPDAAPEAIMALAGSNTRLIILEAPASLTFEMTDIPAVCRLAKARGIRTLVDNSYGAGALFKPLAHGADISMQALSKYAGGHSDLLMGSLAANDPEVSDALQAAYDDMGWFTSADEAYLALRGLRTLHVRLKQHAGAGLKVSEWLTQQPEVSRVLNAALPDFPGHDLFARDFVSGNGLFSVVMKGGSREAAEAFLDALSLFGLGFSWGGFESLAIYCDPQVRNRKNPPAFEGPLLRFHIGLEDTGDLIADLEGGLAAWRAASAG